LTGNSTPGLVTNPGSGSPNRLLYEDPGTQNQPPPTPKAPTAPPTLTATAGGGSVSLSWTAPTNPGSKPISGYKIYRGTTANGEDPTAVATVGNVLSYSDPGLTIGTTYYYRVSAVNQEPLESALSPEASATPTAATPPGAPTLTASTPFFFFSGVNLSWTTPSAGSSPITGYQLWRSTTSGAEVLYATIGVTTSGRDTGTTRGTRYYYKLRAVSAAGVGPLSNESSAIAN
jgi:titin